MMSLWDALRMNMMISYQELVRTFPRKKHHFTILPERMPVGGFKHGKWFILAIV